MNTTIYEKTYESVAKAERHTEHLEAVVNFLKSCDGPTTAKEIGIAVFGAKYNDCFYSNSLSARLGQMLRHLRDGNFVKSIRVDDEPRQIVETEFVMYDNNGQPATIRVHDDEGNSYDMPNPNYRYNNRNSGKWVEVKKWIKPHHNEWVWIGD